MQARKTSDRESKKQNPGTVSRERLKKLSDRVDKFNSYIRTIKKQVEDDRAGKRNE